ncbi:MAG: hypothetical protein A2W01_02540 [Candidatus Solincola sediminis]|uniref:Transposase IS200-like domain-containing protein n=1 Tax=Candidatus Solincola sediminis TaxID=1797199 RepID=A0A1F2WLL7_9ACTN|nr:MAG: hypothetical protein A2Y75_08255 [Candidatus Solincola sediminis]OFW58589.1 MAG: hypothetical protein A2W01_02540 [Candidatus Solincola sediminis]
MIILYIIDNMVRKLREQHEGAHYHIWSRGNKGDYIFEKDEGKDFFVDLLSQGQQRHKVEVYGYCVLGNHYHLHVQTLEENLSEFMHFIGSSYATYLYRNDWKGHVFSSRYNSKHVKNEGQLRSLSRYIHLNPVRAGLTELPEQYCWSSYQYYLLGARPTSWLNTRWIGDYFGSGVESAAESYKDFILEGMEKVIKNSGRISPIESAYHAICETYNLESLDDPGFESEENLRNARSLFIYLAKQFTDLKNLEIARMIGNAGATGISTHYYRICAKVGENAEYAERLYGELRGLIDEYEIDIDDLHKGA